MSTQERIFYCDGSLRDIYVRNTTFEDWRKLLLWVRAGKYKITYKIGETEASLPSDFDEVEKRMSEFGQLLSIYVEGAILNCHFFWMEEIEFDLLPNEVDTEEKAEAILEFMKRLGRY